MLLQSHPASQSLILNETEEAVLTPKSAKSAGDMNGWFSGGADAEDSSWEDSAVVVDMDEKSQQQHPSKTFKLVGVSENRLQDLQTANTHLLPARQLLQLLEQSKHVDQTLEQYCNELSQCYINLTEDCSKVDCSCNGGASFSTLLAQQGAIGLTVEISKKILSCSSILSSEEMEPLIRGPLGFLTEVCC